jgi:hypothetical protein
MENQKRLDERIWEIKNKIHDLRDYISSDFCTKCADSYREIHKLEIILKELEDERNRQS